MGNRSKEIALNKEYKTGDICFGKRGQHPYLYKEFKLEIFAYTPSTILTP